MFWLTAHVLYLPGDRVPGGGLSGSHLLQPGEENVNNHPHISNCYNQVKKNYNHPHANEKNLLLSIAAKFPKWEDVAQNSWRVLVGLT